MIVTAVAALAPMGALGMSLNRVFLGSFLIGLMLGVFAMLAGVERPARRGPVPPTGPVVSREALMTASGEISARFHIPLVSAFATSFGGVGYLVDRYSSLDALWQLSISTGVGVISAACAVMVVAGWALPGARRDIPDERYLLQGLVARVTDPIDPLNGGRIALEMNGTVHAVRAVSLTGGFIDRGTEVVIERVEADTAFVEPWANVERRL
jgi:membrane protein implicated in regulation of membrane protease activity